MKKNEKFRYSAEQIEFLRTGYLSMNVRSLTQVFNAKFGMKKTEPAINSALKNHRITCGRAPKERLVSRRLRIYTQEQVQFLKDNYADRSVKELTAIFNERFGAEKTVQQIKTFVSNRGITSGRTGHFKKGHTPWNAGTKGQGLTGANSGSFKKGNVPPNYKPLGSERICSKDGYILIKIAERDPYTGFPTRYKHKHVHVWEQAHGPVPKGMVIVFRDGNIHNIEIGNLMLISRAELLRLNKHGYKDMPYKLKPSVLALAKLETKIFAKGKKRKSMLHPVGETSINRK